MGALQSPAARSGNRHGRAAGSSMPGASSSQRRPDVWRGTFGLPRSGSRPTPVTAAGLARNELVCAVGCAADRNRRCHTPARPRGGERPLYSKRQTAAVLWKTMSLVLMSGLGIGPCARRPRSRACREDVQLPECREWPAPKSGRAWKSWDENMKKSGSTEGRSASELIDERIAGLGDWRGETLSRMRELIRQADPEVVEEWKWMGTPVWSHDGIICTGESYTSKLKLTFAKGASLKDSARLFNSSLDGNVRRAIDIHEGEEVDAGAFKALIRAAVALNTSGGKARSRRAK